MVTRLPLKIVSRRKAWGGRRIVKKFPGKGWNHVTVNRLIATIRATGSVARKTGSGRQKTVCTEENKDRVEELIQSQEENPGSHKSLREVASELEVSKSFVQRMGSHEICSLSRGYMYLGETKRSEEKRKLAAAT